MASQLPPPEAAVASAVAAAAQTSAADNAGFAAPRKRKQQPAPSAASSSTSSPSDIPDNPTEGKKTPPPLRGPVLTVDLAAIAGPEEVAVPKTPANVRALKRTELHEAVLAADTNAVANALSTNPTFVRVKDEHGWTPLHNAAALTDGLVRNRIVHLLLDHDAEIHSADNQGYTALHWAAACGNADVLETLLSAGARVAQPSAAGETALHRAARLGRTDIARRLLEAGGAETFFRLNDACESCIDVAGRMDGRLNRVARANVRRALLEQLPEARTLVLHHPDCMQHLTGDTHQEHPLRLESILRRLIGPNAAGGRGSASLYGLPEYEFRACSDFLPASVEALSRAHDKEYVFFVEEVALRLQRAPPHSPVPFTPLVQRAGGMASTLLKDPKACDSRFSSGTHAAARRAAGAVVHAIDAVMSGCARNALCIVRPPGHHAGRRGLIPGSASCGFCVFNSVMVGATHALLGPQPLARVAVVDFDVHHGDGTEEIARHLARTLPPQALLVASIHLFDPGDSHISAFYPSSGGADAMLENVINVPITPMWRRGSASAASHKSRGGGVGTQSPALHTWGSGRLEWRAAFAQRIIPAVRAFCPSLLLLASGFDGGQSDIGNSKLDANEKYHQGLDLTPADFEWATEQLLAVAARCCPGKVVSVLEGGYGTYEFSKTSATGWTIERTQLVENVAGHLSALAGIEGRSA